MRVQESYIDTFTAQVAAQASLGAFPSTVWKNWRWGDSWIHSTAQSKEHSILCLKSKEHSVRDALAGQVVQNGVSFAQAYASMRV